jgi:lipase maturation factor 1
MSSMVSSRTSCRRVRWLYLRALGIVSLIAFWSLWTQILGLIGEAGLLPIAPYLELAHERLGNEAWRVFPTLCWLDASDRMLTGLCAAGCCLSLLLIVGIAPRWVLFGLWVTYLSLCVAGRTFLSFQWDILLLEAFFCSLLYAPPTFGKRSGMNEGDAQTDAKGATLLSGHEPLPIARWVLWGLAFKLMFLSGVTKLLSADPAWSEWTALNYHYFTQPIPSWPSWYVQHLPEWFHQVSVLLMFVIEVGLPFLVFCGKWGRAVFCLATILLMVLIQATGNFGFFNLLTAVVCLPLLDDDTLSRILPKRWRPATAPVAPGGHAPVRMLLGTALGGLILLANLLVTVREMERTQRPEKMPIPVVRALDVGERFLLSWGTPWILEPIAPLRTINGYGLFRVMTTERREIVIEHSDDGENWEEYEFPYKPGSVDRPPPIVAPHMPRLDWQMWFAALNPMGQSEWLSSLAERILEGNASTARLMDSPEITRHPPRYVRYVFYEYEFTTPGEKQQTGAWWTRTRLGELTGPLSLPDLDE